MPKTGTLLPDVITRRHHLNGEDKHFVGNFVGDPLAACGIIDIDDNKIDPMALHETGQKRVERLPPRLSENVSDR